MMHFKKMQMKEIWKPELKPNKTQYVLHCCFFLLSCIDKKEISESITIVSQWICNLFFNLFVPVACFRIHSCFKAIDTFSSCHIYTPKSLITIVICNSRSFIVLTVVTYHIHSSRPVYDMALFLQNLRHEH